MPQRYSHAHAFAPYPEDRSNDDAPLLADYAQWLMRCKRCQRMELPPDAEYRLLSPIEHITNSSAAPGLTINGNGALIDVQMAAGYAFRFLGRTTFEDAVERYQQRSGLHNLRITTTNKDSTAGAVESTSTYGLAITDVHVHKLGGDVFHLASHVVSASTDWAAQFHTRLERVWVTNCAGRFLHTTGGRLIQFNMHDCRIFFCHGGGLQGVITAGTISGNSFAACGKNAPMGFGANLALLWDGFTPSRTLVVEGNIFDASRDHHVLIEAGYNLTFRSNDYASFPRWDPLPPRAPGIAVAIGLDDPTVPYVRGCTFSEYHNSNGMDGWISYDLRKCADVLIQPGWLATRQGESQLSTIRGLRTGPNCKAVFDGAAYDFSGATPASPKRYA